MTKKTIRKLNTTTLRRAQDDLGHAKLTLPRGVASGFNMDADQHRMHRASAEYRQKHGFEANAEFFFLGSRPAVGQQALITVELKGPKPTGMVFFGTVVKVLSDRRVEVIASPAQPGGPAEIARVWRMTLELDLSLENPWAVTEMLKMTAAPIKSKAPLPSGVRFAANNEAVGLDGLGFELESFLFADEAWVGQGAHIQLVLKQPTAMQRRDMLQQPELVGRVSKVLSDDEVEVTATANQFTPARLRGPWKVKLRYFEADGQGWVVTSMAKLVVLKTAKRMTKVARDGR